MEPTLQGALLGSAITLIVAAPPVILTFFRSKAKSSEARSMEDSAKAEKEKLEAENQRFILDLARSNMQTASTLIKLQDKVIEYEKKEQQTSITLERQGKRIAWLEKKVLELGGTIDDDDSYPIKDQILTK